MIWAWLLLAGASGAWASGPGTSVAPIFKFGLGARPAAMGGAFVSVSDDFSASAWNPAGLAEVPQAAAALSDAIYYQGLNLDYLTFAAPLGKYGGIGGHAAYLSTGKIARTGEDPSGSFDANSSGGSFTDSDLKLNLSAAGSPAPWLSLGAGAGYLQDKVDQNSASGVTADMGFLARYDVFRFGMSLDDWGPQVNGLDALPTVLRTGFSAKPLQGLTLAFESDYQFDSLQKVFGLGGEYWFGNIFALRLGYVLGSGNDAGGLRFTGGFGTRVSGFQLDYAFSPFGELGDVHQVSLAYRFGPDRNQLKPSPKNAEPVPVKSEEETVSPEEHFMRAGVLIVAKSYSSANDELAAALAMLASEDRRRVRYFVLMGNIAMDENDAAAAQSFYSDALKLGASLGLSDPSVAEAYAGMGFCLAAQGNKLFAIRYLEKALEFNPPPQTRQAVEAVLTELKSSKK